MRLSFNPLPHSIPLCHQVEDRMDGDLCLIRRHIRSNSSSLIQDATTTLTDCTLHSRTDNTWMIVGHIICFAIYFLFREKSEKSEMCTISTVHTHLWILQHGRDSTLFSKRSAHWFCPVFLVTPGHWPRPRVMSSFTNIESKGLGLRLWPSVLIWA